jgi:hypothetical protein
LLSGTNDNMPPLPELAVNFGIDSYKDFAPTEHDLGPLQNPNGRAGFKPARG